LILFFRWNYWSIRIQVFIELNEGIIENKIIIKRKNKSRMR
jgi:hypothetical protein